MFLELIIRARRRKTTDEYSCALHFEVLVKSKSSEKLGGKLFFSHNAGGGE